MKEFLKTKHTLTLNYTWRKVDITFHDPSVYTILEFQELVRDWDYYEAAHLITKINSKDFYSNPEWILKWITWALFWENKKESWEEWFFPASIDFLAKRYWQNPITLMKELTINQLNTLSQWVEYNANIENWETEKNTKFTLKSIDNDKINEYIDKNEKLQEKLRKKKKNT